MPGYEVYLHVSLLEAMPASGPSRRKILDFIRHLRTYPSTPGDFTDVDPSLRERQIKVIGDYAITDWLDEPARAVLVVDVRPSDK